MSNTPVSYLDTAGTFRQVFGAIEEDIHSLRNGKMKLDAARVILVARKTQLRTAELALAMQRLWLQYNQVEKTAAESKLRKAG